MNTKSVRHICILWKINLIPKKYLSNIRHSIEPKQVYYGIGTRIIVIPKQVEKA